MRKVIIASDTTCDLSAELIKEFDVKIIPLHINFGDETYKDNIEITLNELFEKTKAQKELPKTSATTPGEFYEFFKGFVDEGYDVFYTGIGSKLSITFQNACMVAQEFPGRVFCVDSGNLSTGIGLLVLKACRMKEQGMKAEEIAKNVEAIVPRVKAQFVIDTLEYLHKGGRCSGMARFFSSVLSIKPMIVVRNGGMSVGKKFFGSLKKAVLGMTKYFLADLEHLDPEFVFITHASASDKAVLIKELIKDVKVENVFETSAGCVIGSHCGPGTIGILYILKDQNVKLDLPIEE